MKVVVKFHRNYVCSFREAVASVYGLTDGRTDRWTDDAPSHKLCGIMFQVSEKLSHSLHLRNQDEVRVKVLLNCRFIFQFMFRYVFKI